MSITKLDRDRIIDRLGGLGNRRKIAFALVLLKSVDNLDIEGFSNTYQSIKGRFPYQYIDEIFESLEASEREMSESFREMVDGLCAFIEKRNRQKNRQKQEE